MINVETRAGRTARITFLTAWLVITLFPLYWILVTSFKPRGAIFSFPLTYWPTDFTLENYTSPSPRHSSGPTSSTAWSSPWRLPPWRP